MGKGRSRALARDNRLLVRVVETLKIELLIVELDLLSRKFRFCL